MKKIITTLVLIFAVTLTACTPTIDEPNEEVKHNVILHTNNGDVDKTLTVNDGSAVSDLDLLVTYEGYALVGWFLDSSLTNQVDFETVTEDIVLYAKWVEYFEYTLTFHIGDTTTTLIAPNGQLGNVSSGELEGHRFVGWYYESTFDTRFGFETSIDGDLDLYGKFTLIETYTYVVFNNIIIDKFLQKYGEEASLTEHDLPGFTFEGWYTEATYENEVTTVTGADKTTLIYANYSLADEVIDLTELDYYSYLSASNPEVTITVKDMGTMTLQLFPSVSKNTVDNFIAYIQDQDYTNSTFHRIIAGFMIQGGIVEETHCPIEGHFGDNGIVNNLEHTRGILSMARTSVMDSATSQFFIMHDVSPHLDGGYAAFGGLTSGFNLLDLIAWQVTNSADMPINQVVIESMTVELNGYVPGTVTCAD